MLENKNNVLQFLCLGLLWLSVGKGVHIDDLATYLVSNIQLYFKQIEYLKLCFYNDNILNLTSMNHTKTEIHSF